MDIKTERGQVRKVAARWRAQYGHGQYRTDRKKQAIQRALDALDVEQATAADVKAIIGNDSWVELPECHECGAKTWQAAELGQPPDYESATATVCLDCLKAAVAAIESGAQQ